MPHKVIFTRQALSDLAQAHSWLLQAGSGPASLGKLRRIQAAIKDLSLSPFRWPVGSHPGVRELPTADYRVMYEVMPRVKAAQPEDIRILRVFGPYQDRDRL